MWRILFLILILFSSAVLARTYDQLAVVKFDEFETASSNEVKSRINKYFTKLNYDPIYGGSSGLIISYGTSKEIINCQKQIQKLMKIRNFEGDRMIFEKGGYQKKIITELWIVPLGTERPQFKREPVMMGVITKLTNSKTNSKLDDFLTELFYNPKQKGYILSRGSTKDILIREKYVKKYLLTRHLDSSRVTFLKNENNQSIKTEIWLDLGMPIQANKTNPNL